MKRGKCNTEESYGRGSTVFSLVRDRVRKDRILIFFLILFTSTAIAQADTIVVNTSIVFNPGDPNTYWSSIQQAINDADNGDVLIVKPDVYEENIDFSGKVLTVRSGHIRDYNDPTLYPEQTIIDGGGSGSVVTFESGEGPDSVLKGFTITGGSAIYGGGIECYQTAPTIENCIISLNESEFGGGGVDFYYSSGAVVKDCIIKKNGAWEGGGVSSYFSSASITSCVFEDNTAGDIGAGLGIFSSFLDVKNCFVADNTATYSGGAICTDASDSRISNCTIINNQAGSTGIGGIHCSGTNQYIPEIKYSIIWGNGDDLYNCEDWVTYSCIQDGAPGLTNKNDDPLFIGDYYLSNIDAGQEVNSPCVDQGPVQASDVGLDGLTTRTDQFPDSDKLLDWGYHYQPKDVPEYTLDINPSSNGNIEVEPGGLSYPPHTTVEVTARPDPNYRIAGFFIDADNVVDANDPNIAAGGEYTAKVVMDADHTAGALFAEKEKVTLTVLKSGLGGRLIEPPRSSSITNKYRVGDTATIKTKPDEGYVAVWDGTDDDFCFEPNNTVTFGVNDVTPDSNEVTVEVSFQDVHNKFYLGVEVTGADHGTVNPKSGYFDKFTEVTLNATLDSGYTISWDGTENDASSDTTNTVYMDSDKYVKVAIEPKIYGPNVITFPSNKYNTIQDAVDAAQAGDTVLLNKGTYELEDDIYINKSIRLTGPAPNNPDIVDKTIISGTLTYRALTLGPSCGPNTVISGITFQDISCYMIYGGDSSGAGIYISPYISPTIVNCNILNIRMRAGYGGDGEDGQEQPEDPNEPWQQGGENGGRGGNGGDALGGGIYCDIHSTPNIRNVHISDCEVVGGDGGDGGNGVSPESEEALPSPNGGDGGDGGRAGSAYGGGIYIGDGGHPIIEACIIEDCRATAGNAGDAGDGGDGYQNDVIYAGGDGGDGGENGRAYGGGIYFGSNSHADVIDTRVINCRTVAGNAGDGGDGGSVGGAAGIGGGYDGDYWRNSALGGGVHCEQNADVNFVNCTFRDNNVVPGFSGIGGILAEPERSYLIPTSGSGVYLNDNTITKFTDCGFIDNKYTDVMDPCDPNKPAWRLDPFISYGGGISGIYVGSVKVEDCEFTGNFAPIGGGIYVDSSKSRVRSSLFNRNKAFKGAGIYCVESSDTTIKACNLAYNEAEDVNESAGGEGGGILLANASGMVENSKLNHNLAETSGGAVYVSGGQSSNLHFKNCLINANKAGRNGAGISCNWRVEASLSNCTIADNEVTGLFGFGYGGGMYCSYNSDVDINDSIIWGNNSNYQGAQIAVGSGDPNYSLPSVLNIEYSDIEPEPDPNEVTEITALDLVFCIDTTGSMGGDIEEVKESASEIIDLIASDFPDYRIAVVNYQDFNESPYGNTENYPYRDDATFTKDTSTLLDAIDSLEASGGADGPESVLAALMHCINHEALRDRLDPNYLGADPNWTGPGQWRTGSNVSRVIILMGDAPPHVPPSDPCEPFTGYLIEDVAKAATERPAPIRIFTIPVRGWDVTIETFTELAEGTGGSMLEAAGSHEVVDAITTAIGLIAARAPMVYVDNHCELNGWIAESNSWDPNTHNIAEDPCFVNIREEPNLIPGYYLSQLDAGQDFQSPCVDAGSDLVTAPSVGLDPNEHTTRTDAVGDTGIVDMGYHYLISQMPKLTIKIVDSKGEPVDPNLAHGYVEPEGGKLYPKGTFIDLKAYPDTGYEVEFWKGTDDDEITGPNNTVTMNEDKLVKIRFKARPVYELDAYVVGEHGTIEPQSGYFYEDEVVKLVAHPDEGYRLKRWEGTDDDSSFELTNTVTMTEDKVVSVRFEFPEIIKVSGGDEALRQAIGSARDGDTLVVDEGTYDGGINLKGKAVTVTSKDPQNPDIVGMTIIDGDSSDRGFIFDNGETSDTVVEGFTIINGTNTDANGVVIRERGGGGIYVGSGCSPTIRNVVIRDCNARTDPNGSGLGYGGGIYVGQDSSPKFINCLVADSNAEKGGGAYCDSNSSAVFKYSTFTGNSAETGGGICYFQTNMLAEIYDCNIYNNTAEYGAGISVESQSDGLLNNSYVIGNDAEISGGGVYIFHANGLSITDCNLMYNTAKQGAGIYTIDSSNIDVAGSDIKYNEAPTIGILDEANEPNSNAVGRGGGIYSWGSDILIVDTHIMYNTANISGGGLYLAKEPNSPQIINCLIANNMAGRDGGGASVNWFARPLFANCTIVSNAARGTFGMEENSGYGGALYCGYYSDSTLLDSIVWNNSAVSGTEIYVGTGFEYDQPWPARLTVTYCDVMGGRTGVKVDYQCRLVWGDGNILSEPGFIAGPKGKYYLRQVDAGQAVQSPCVDAGSGYASNLGLNMYTTRTDELFDKGIVDIGYHYSLSEKAEPCKLCDLIFDGFIDFSDFAAFALKWLNQGCSEGNGWCQGSDFTFDNEVEYGDLAFFTDCWLREDTSAPIPDPSRWVRVPYISSTTAPYAIGMSAETSYDAWGWDVEYYFDCLSDSKYDSGWQSDPNYEVTDLALGTELCFRVQVRDEKDNKTGFSKVKCTIVSEDGVEVDSNAPVPVPYIKTIEANSPNTITMTSSQSYDDSGVEYYFENLTIEDHNSGWQQSRTYADKNLVPDTTYCYRVRARDKTERIPDDGTGEPGNKTVWSETVCKSTEPEPDTTPPWPDPMQWDPVTDANGNDGSPRQYLADDGKWHITMRAHSGTYDEEHGVEFRFEPSEGEDYYGSGWISFPDGPPFEYDLVAPGGKNTALDWRVRARDTSSNHNETAPTDWKMPPIIY